MVEASIAASHVALFELIGKSVIGVFQTLSRGNTEQIVPGKTTPIDGVLEWGSDDARASRVHAITTLTFMITNSSTTLELITRLEHRRGPQLLLLKRTQSSDGEARPLLAHTVLDELP